MHVRYNFGGTWKFPCCIKKNEETGSVLAIHWFEFVRLKGLRPNDEVILVAEFSSGKKTQMQLSMELKRKITLFGKDIWGMFTFDKDRLFCLDAVGRSGKAWTLLASFQTNEAWGSVFSISCPEFVREYALRANDEVIFVRQALDDNDKAPRMKFKIEVRRKIRLFGQDIWGEVMV
ncbi:hypothetical protein QQP08_006847 [Theobroma cacao]|nr:hypothetical protein QQP08_006847 [Theobroma cacao]